MTRRMLLCMAFVLAWCSGAPSPASAQAPASDATVVQDTTAIELLLAGACFAVERGHLCGDPGPDVTGPSLTIAPDRPFEIRLSEPISEVAVRSDLGRVSAVLVDPRTVLVTPAGSLAGQALAVTTHPIEGGSRLFVGTYLPVPPTAEPPPPDGPPAVESVLPRTSPPVPARFELRRGAGRHRIGTGIRFTGLATRTATATVTAAIRVRGRVLELRRKVRFTANRPQAFALHPTAAQARALRRGMPRAGRLATVTVTGIGPGVTRNVRLVR